MAQVVTETMGVRDLQGEVLADELVKAKRHRDTADKQYKALSEVFISTEEDRIDGTLGHVTRVEPTRATLDEDKLRKLVSDEVWEKITERKVNTAYLEDAVARGLLPSNVVAKATKVKATKPYAKVTAH